MSEPEPIRALAPRNEPTTRIAAPATYTEMMQIGKVLAESGYFADAKSMAQAAAKIIAGAEAGFGPMASMTGIHIIQGKVAFGANLMAAAVKRSGRYNYKVVTLDDTNCCLEFYEGGKPVGKSSFTIDEAKAASLLSNQTWQKYPRNMLFARAMSNGIRWYCPDVFDGVTAYTPDEMGANITITEQGEEVVEAAKPEPPKTSRPASPVGREPSPSQVTPHQDDDDKPATKGMLDRWAAIYQQAAELGVKDIPTIPSDISAALLTTRAKDLKVRIAERERELQANRNDWVDVTDEEIAASELADDSRD